MKMMLCPQCWGNQPKTSDTPICSHCQGKGTVGDLQLSDNFWLSEMLSSSNAIREHVSNVPSTQIVAHLQSLCKDILEPIRCYWGPVRVSSGYRSPAVNAIVHGSPAHPSGFAADINIGSGRKVLVDWIIQAKIPFDQVIFEGTWVHVSRFRPDGTNPRGMALATFDGGHSYVSYDPTDPRIHT